MVAASAAIIYNKTVSKGEDRYLVSHFRERKYAKIRVDRKITIRTF